MAISTLASKTVYLADGEYSYSNVGKYTFYLYVTGYSTAFLNEYHIQVELYYKFISGTDVLNDLPSFRDMTFGIGTYFNNTSTDQHYRNNDFGTSDDWGNNRVSSPKSITLCGTTFTYDGYYGNASGPSFTIDESLYTQGPYYGVTISCFTDVWSGHFGTSQYNAYEGNTYFIIYHDFCSNLYSPTVSFTNSPTELIAGENVTLQWTMSDADSTDKARTTYLRRYHKSPSDSSYTETTLISKGWGSTETSYTDTIPKEYVGYSIYYIVTVRDIAGNYYGTPVGVATATSNTLTVTSAGSISGSTTISGTSKDLQGDAYVYKDGAWHEVTEAYVMKDGSWNSLNP